MLLNSLKIFTSSEFNQLLNLPRTECQLGQGSPSAIKLKGFLYVAQVSVITGAVVSMTFTVRVRCHQSVGDRRRGLECRY